MNTFSLQYRNLAARLLETDPIHTGEWHSRDTSGSAAHATYELLNVQQLFPVPPTVPELQAAITPNLPWADMHFMERVSGVPFNPPPSHVHWPWATHNGQHQDKDQRFSHTYPERYWPKHAGHAPTDCPHAAELKEGRKPGYYSEAWKCGYEPHRGIRGSYGDLEDVVKLLVRNPLTRQAYFPVWFPEDTGNVSHVRVPCSIGYHFMIRDHQLHCWYTMRSCDFMRHYRDDVYMTARLVQWMAGVVQPGIGVPLEPGRLHVTISSLHAFVGDTQSLRMISKHGGAAP
jgi:thymidylate synthase